MIQTCHAVASLPLNSSPLPPLLFLAIIIIIIIIPARPSPLLAILISPSLSSKHPLWITSIPHRDILTLSMVSRHSAKMFPLTLYSNERERDVGGDQYADQCTNLNNLSPATHVSNTMLRGDYTALFLFFVFLPPACQGWDAWWKKTQSLQSGPVAGASAFSLGAAGFRRDRSRWRAPKAASFAWHALYNERRNLSKCHSSTKCLALIPTKCCRVPPCLLWQSLQLY